MFEASSDRQYIIGAKQVRNAVKSKKASKVFIASDSDSDVIEPIIALAKENGIEISYIDTRKELGHMCGIDVKAACAAQTV